MNSLLGWLAASLALAGCLIAPPQRPAPDAGLASLECGEGSGLYCGVGTATGTPVCHDNRICLCRAAPDSCLPVDGRVCREGACAACAVDGDCGDPLRRCCDPTSGRCRTTQWSRVARGGDGPEMLAGAAVAFDSLRRQVWLFGGWASNLASDRGGETWPRADLWMLELAAAGGPQWQRVAASGEGVPAPRMDASLVHDPVGDRLVLFGGNRSCVDLAGRCGVDGGVQAQALLDDVWTLSLASRTWRQLPKPLGGPDQPVIWPSPRGAHAAAYDLRTQRLFVWAGYSSSAYLGELWSLTVDPRLDASSVQRWTRHDAQPPAEVPTPRIPHYAHDPVTGRLVVLGGRDGSPAGAVDVWSLALGEAPRWTRLAATHPLFEGPNRLGGLGVGAYDYRQRSFVFMATARGPNMPIHLDAERPLERFCTLDDNRLDDARSGAPVLYDPAEHALLLVSGAAVNLTSGEDVAKRLHLGCLGRRLPRDGSRQCNK